MDLLSFIFIVAGVVSVLFIKDWIFSNHKDPVPLEPESLAIPWRTYTLDELHKFNGKDPQKKVLLSIQGKVYSVPKAKYGINGGYNVFAGKEITIPLATFSFQETNNIDPQRWRQLSLGERHQLEEWKETFDQYPVVGEIPEVVEIANQVFKNDEK
eukprot:gb/GECH01010560.1/.p1 GENE.gb/GECH01010560.1/~~gb/GECH01010560.1/.p1  ORF type:complete len:156 (+),score=43.06 gb/GECH01010560.1/:1-468(+)